MAGWRGRPIGRTARGRLPRHAYPRERLPSRRRVARGRLLFTRHAGPCKGEGPPSLHSSCWPLQRRGAAFSSLVMLALAKARSRLLFTRHAGPCKDEEPPSLHSSCWPLQRRGAASSSLVTFPLAKARGRPLFTRHGRLERAIWSGTSDPGNENGAPGGCQRFVYLLGTKSGACAPAQHCP